MRSLHAALVWAAWVGLQEPPLIASAASVASANDDVKHARVMRAELGRKKKERRREVRVEAMDAQGHLLETRVGEPIVPARGEMLQMRTDPDVPDIACNDEYPLGRVDTSQCAEAHHNLIVDQEMCAQAAEMSNAGVDHDRFVLTEEWWEAHPRGCFAWPCFPGASSKSGMCYFFNPVGDDPCRNSNSTHRCKGQPICYGVHYQNGTTNTNGGCPHGYQVLMDETKCLAAASCLGFCVGTQFRMGVANASQHMDHPEGCFIHEDEGCLYFNPPNELGKPSRPSGIPVCNATEVGHHWPNTS